MREDVAFPNKRLFHESLFKDFHELYQGHLGEIEWPRKMAYVLIFLCLGKVVVDLRERCLDDCCSVLPQDIESMNEGFALALPDSMRIKIKCGEKSHWLEETECAATSCVDALQSTEEIELPRQLNISN